MKSRNVLIALLLLLPLSLASAQSRSGTVALEQAIALYQQSQFEEALLSFRDITVDPALGSVQGTAYFWVGKTALALNRFDDAERNIDLFLSQYPDNPNVAEAVYLRARLLFLQEEYEEAVIAFSSFVETYPASSFVANAYYWGGESLYALGRFTEAERAFSTVVSQFPTSFRVEAARYRLELIALGLRERELFQLLQWSHEEALRAQDELRRATRDFEEALASYQQQLGGNAPVDSGTVPVAVAEQLTGLQQNVSDLQAELDRQQAREQVLQEQLDRSQSQVFTLQGQVNTLQQRLAAAPGPNDNDDDTPIEQVGDTDIERRLELLRLKEQALDIKEFYLELLIREARGE